MSDESKLNKNLETLTEALQKQNNPKRMFMMSILQGAGSVIGATIVAGVLLLVLSKFIHSVESLPVFGNLFRSTQVETAIQQKINQK